MLAAEMDAHVNVPRSRLVGGMQCHGDGAFVVTEQHGRKRLSEAEITQEETRVEWAILSTSKASGEGF
jgi:hypothetical protein